MNIYLGNLQLKEIVKDEHLDIIQLFLDNNGFKHTANTSEMCQRRGNYHIFDIPRVMTICGEDKMDQFISFLKENDLVGKGFIGPVGLTYQDLEETQ